MSACKELLGHATVPFSSVVIYPIPDSGDCLLVLKVLTALLAYAMSLSSSSPWYLIHPAFSLGILRLTRSQLHECLISLRIWSVQVS